MGIPTIKHVRAFTLRGGGADYHDQADGHWIDDHIATPMSKYPEYRQSRRTFGINVLGTLVVEIEASDGTVGFAVTTCLLYTSPSPRDGLLSRMPSSA